MPFQPDAEQGHSKARRKKKKGQAEEAHPTAGKAARTNSTFRREIFARFNAQESKLSHSIVFLYIFNL